MGRGKLKLEFIANEKTRKTTFHKRKKGMLKKANEFAILCGIDICLFISGPKLENNSQPTELETWPSERSKVMSIIKKYQTAILRKPPKKVHSLTDTFVERKKKIESEILRCRKMYYEAKYPTSLELIDHLSLDQMWELVHRLDGKIEAIQSVIKVKKESDQLRKQKNQTLSLISSSNKDSNQLHQLLLNENPDQSTYSSTTCSNYHMQYYSTITTNLRGPIYYKDSMAGNIQQMASLDGTFFENSTAEIQRMESCMAVCPNYYMQYSSTTASSAQLGPVLADPTTGMLPTMFNGSAGVDTSSIPVQAHYYTPLQVQPQPQPPSVPYMQYPMNVVNLARRINGPIYQVRSSSGGRNELPQV